MKLGWLTLISILHLPVVHAETLGDVPLASFPPFDASWQASDPEAQDLTEERLELRTDGLAYAFLEKRLSHTAILAEVQFDDAEAVFLGIRVQANPPLSGYLLDLSRDGSVSLVTLVDGEDTVLVTGDAGLNSASGSLKMCYRLTAQSLAAWIWPADGEPSEMPTIESLLTEPLRFAEGRPVVGVRGGGAQFSSVEVGGELYRPEILSLEQLEPDVRFRLKWESVANEVYRIDASESFVGMWRPVFLHKATGDASEIVVAARTRQGAFRVVALSGNVLVNSGIPIRVTPNAAPTSLTWVSSDDRVYGFEWSLDLLTWQRFGGVSIEGASGLQATTAVLALPDTLDPDEISGLYWRVVELSDTDSFGIVPSVAE